MAKSPFKLKSGNSPLFKHMGSSPVQKKYYPANLNPSDTTTGQMLPHTWEGGTSPEAQEYSWYLDQKYSGGPEGERGSVQSDQPAPSTPPKKTPPKATSPKATPPKKATPKKKPYIKPGGKATGSMKDYAIGSKERYAEYEARGWAHDATTKGGKPTVKQYTTSGKGVNNVDTSKQSVAVGPQTKETTAVNKQEFPTKGPVNTTKVTDKEVKPKYKSRKKIKQEKTARKSSGELTRREIKYEKLASKAESALAEGKGRKAKRLAKRANKQYRKKGVNTTGKVDKTSDKLTDLDFS